VPAVLIGIVATALLAVVFEVTLWRPMRSRGAALPQLLLMTVGLAFLIRNGIQLVAGTESRAFHIDVITTVQFWGLRIGRVQLLDVVVGFATLIAVGLLIRYSKLGKEMRAVSDDAALAETTGIDTQRVAIATWILGGGLAALAGVLYASALGAMTPNLGFSLILALFAAAVPRRRRQRVRRARGRDHHRPFAGMVDAPLRLALESRPSASRCSS